MTPTFADLSSSASDFPAPVEDSVIPPGHRFDFRDIGSSFLPKYFAGACQPNGVDEASVGGR